MCGRFTLTSSIDRLQGRFHFQAGDLQLHPRYNISPTQQVLTITNQEARRVELMRWGLIPHWAKEASTKYSMINAMAETASEKPAFRAAFRKRRCLVLADGFYEWRKVESGKVPMHIVLRSREPFAFAGLWEYWNSPSGETVGSCTIITTTPNSRMAEIHNRMPVILPEEAEALWLDSETEDPMVLKALLIPFPSESMEAYPVSTLVNSPKHDTPECVLPVS